MILLATPMLSSAGDLDRCSAADSCFDKLPWSELESRVEVEDIQQDFPEADVDANDSLWMTSQPRYTFHTGMSGSPTIAGWANVNSTSAKVVHLRSTDDAIHALQFVSKNKVAVAVRGTGHDWFGRSSASGTLLLWTHHLNETHWHDAFAPSGCNESVNGAVTLGAGVQFWQLYQEADEHRRIAIGGTCATVGHVGFSTAGGYGDFSRMYGSGASNLVEAEVVLATGEKVIANMCQYADLFRALRGGGGAFGLVTKATYRTYSWPQWIGSANVTFEGYADGVSRFGRWYRSVVQQGLSKHFGGQVQVGGYAGNNKSKIELAYVGSSAEHCRALLQNLSADIECVPRFGLASGESADPTSSAVGVPGWENSWEADQASSYHELSLSRYFRLEDIEEGRLQSFAEAIDHIASFPFLNGIDHDAGVILGLNYGLGHGSDTALAHVRETTVNPEVSDSLGTVKLDVRTARFTPDANTLMNTEAWETLQSVRKVLDELLAGRGSYYNEGDYTEEAWQESYWGSNYAELLRTKSKYDPDNIFSCHQCVGSEKSGFRESVGRTRRLRGV